MLFFLLFGFTSAIAQVKFTTVASSKEIGRNDYVQIEFVVENAQQIERLAHPNFQDFHIVQGPIQSSGMSVVNGSMSQYKALSFVLQPIKTGRFTIPGATATIDGKPMHSNSVTIEVSANGSSNGNSQPMPQSVWPGEPADVDKEYFLKNGENVAQKINKNLFVKVDVSKTHCYVGEPIVATYKLYSRLQSESRVIKHPSLNGFSVYDMIDPNNDMPSVETVNGKPFTVHVIRKAQLIPLQAGIVDLDPVEIENTVHFLKNVSNQNKQNSSRDIFDNLLDEDVRAVPVEQNITLESKPVSISVKDLPQEHKPADFNGAVGHFSVHAAIENKNISSKDADVLKLTVKGNGNLPVVNAPTIQWPAGVENYEPTTKENIDKTIAPLGGSKTFEYSFIPQQAGDYVIPPVQFAYFDPASGSYKTTSTEELKLTVKASKNKKNTPSVVTAAPSPNEGSNSISDFLQEHLEWFFAVIILSGLAVYLWVQNRRLKKAQEAEQMAVAKAKEAAMAELAKALSVPPDPLQKAKLLLERGDFRTFYTELNRALWNAVADKLNLPASELNKHNIVMQLQSRGWDNKTTMLLEAVLHECEMKLYTPDYSESGMQKIIQSAEEIVAVLNAV
jgi:hypothetical protein